ncbi:syntaxin-71-like [Momordica charantia]|uniref:Syntaxin-71-like n=1 Tax=Momordica charantia TaxID=3673 RepID=A0A6J1CG77_MOMCH|nr:syntaxin-71-like [Momordica charantia]
MVFSFFSSSVKNNGIFKEELAVRGDLVLALEERIKAIPDGATSAGKQSGGWASSSSSKNIKFDSSSDGNFESEYFQQSEESSQFRQDYEMRKMKQDQGLDIISEGLDMLKDLAHEMNEELDRQVPLIDEIDAKVDKVTNEIKNTNVRLKETLYEVRSSQNFCIDIILLCVILGIASYLYNILS